MSLPEEQRLVAYESLCNDMTPASSSRHMVPEDIFTVADKYHSLSWWHCRPIWNANFNLTEVRFS